MKRLLVCVVAFLALSGCAVRNSMNESRGRGDAPVGAVDDTPKNVIQFPDRFSNVAHACDGHGHRVFVTTRSDTSRFMVVVDDASCGGTSSSAAGSPTTTPR